MPKMPVSGVPFSPISVRESDTPPPGFDRRVIPGAGSVKYYVATVAQDTYEYWVQRDDRGEVTASEWITTKESAVAEFVWPSAKDRSSVDVTRVYDLYVKSVAKAVSSKSIGYR